MRILRASVLVLLSLTSGCSDAPSPPKLDQIPLSLQTIEFRSAEADFHQDLQAGNVHLVGVWGIGPAEFPGLPEPCLSELGKTIERVMIEGTSDAGGVLNGLAQVYAEEYNRLLLAYLRNHGSPEVRRLTRRCS